MQKTCFAVILTFFTFVSRLHASDAADLATELQALETADTTAASEVTSGGIYYSAKMVNQYGAIGLLPFPTAMNYPAWNLGDNVWLFDDLPSALPALRSGIHADDASPPDFSDTNNDDTEPTNISYLSLPPINTNILWLQITNVANGLVYANLNMATDTVYAIWSTTNLSTPLAEWQVATELWPTNAGTNTMPFTASTGSNPNLFLRAEDWTSVTADGNSTPLWWFYYWFGTTDLSDTNLDSQGGALVNDYNGETDPNVINFIATTPNFNVNQTWVPVTINLITGTPSYYAVLVNDTNLMDAVWQPYTGTNLTVNLGSTNGLYNVWIGLRGLPANAQQTWDEGELSVIVSLTSPSITVTNPAASTVSRPLIQVQGYVNEPVTNLDYDISNAAGIFTNQTGYVTGQYYDTNLLKFTTNWFQCYDIPVTNGLNTITLHAKDLAGNVTLTNFNYTLVYSTNPPVLALVWPLPNTPISGSNFTVQATVDDDTANVTASITDTNGDTNKVAAVVERNGNLWANNLPLAAGTNTVTLTATDAAGNVNTTNFTVVQSGVNLTINPIATNYLNQSTATVTGTVTVGQNVWVNGQPASVDGYGNWSATVPVNPMGVANVMAQAGTDTNDIESSQTFQQTQPPTVQVMSFSAHEHQTESSTDGNSWILDETIDWAQGSIGSLNYQNNGTGCPSCGPPSSDSYSVPITSINQPWVSVSVNNSYQWTSGDFLVDPYTDTYAPDNKNDSYSFYQHTQTAVAPSGVAVAGKNVVYLVEACASEMVLMSGNIPDDSPELGGVPFNSYGSLPYPPEWLQIQKQTLVNTGETNVDGSVWGATTISAPAGTQPDVTTTATQFYNNNAYSGTNQVFPLTLQIMDANTGMNLSAQTNTVLVGQQMNFTARFSITNTFMTNFSLTNFQWTVPGVTFSNYVADDLTGILYTDFSTTQSNVAFYWVNSGIQQVQCEATVNGKTVIGYAKFNVQRPLASITATGGTVALDQFYSFPYTSSFRLHCGILATNYYGMTYFCTVRMPSSYTGNTNLEWIQEVTYTNLVHSTNGFWYKKTITPFCLDTDYPYNDIANAESENDSPASQILDGFDAVNYSENFTMWLMFKPDGVNSQWIPLRKVSWAWGGAGNLVTNGFAINWVQTSTNNPGNPTDAVSFDHPQWYWNAANTNVFYWRQQ